MNNQKAVSVLYLDLDGTVRHGLDELEHFVNAPEDVVIFPEALEKMRQAKAVGCRIVAITNQGGVALGHMSQEVALEVMQATRRACIGLFDQMQMCVHHPEASSPEWAVCWCRKPRIGSIVEAVGHLEGFHKDEYYPPHMSLFVGDREEDRQCAENAGIPFQWAEDWRK